MRRCFLPPLSYLLSRPPVASYVIGMTQLGRIALFAVTAACLSCTATDSHGIDRRLAPEIAGIKAVDNHAPPVRPTAAGEAPDMEFDALPVDNLEAQSDP